MARTGVAVRRLVTLSTDIGWAYAAQMKAVLLRRLRADRIVDLAHDLPRHRIREAAFLLRAMAAGFPPGTVHVCVVDPGVGGRRAGIAIECQDGSALVGPDNGVLSLLAAKLGVRQAVVLDRGRVSPAGRSGDTFDGRDLFAPAAARLAAGEPISRLGRGVARVRSLDLPAHEETPGGVSGRVIFADHFGNLISNVPSEAVRAKGERVDVTLGRRRLGALPWVRSYEALGRGRLGLLPSSFGLLELSIAEGSAAGRLRAGPGQRLVLRWRDRRRRPRRPRSRARNRK